MRIQDLSEQIVGVVHSLYFVIKLFAILFLVSPFARFSLPVRGTPEFYQRRGAASHAWCFRNSCAFGFACGRIQGEFTNVPEPEASIFQHSITVFGSLLVPKIFLVAETWMMASRTTNAASPPMATGSRWQWSLCVSLFMFLLPSIN